MGPVGLSAVRARAVEDAERAQRSVSERAARKGEEAPPYVLVELIGKGSYGRVYKGEDTRTREVVAVKIIDIDESDTANPRLADTYSEFLKEITALKVLSEGKAKNINHIIDALPVGQTMWMVTEHCGGGSVATLMRPKPGGLEEKYIIPILREVAEALGWVHRAGIIHRDVKCANILLTTAGSVQLCDFGVAGTLSATTDKRSTFIGTPHWMAPELFTTTTSASDAEALALSYGAEVDIWAFGAVVYEVATGLPPNAAKGVMQGHLGASFASSIPRLKEGAPLYYSAHLRDLAAFCLDPDPLKRPAIEQVQRHPYIHDTHPAHPTTALLELITRFRAWEAEGGVRGSLFMSGGAAGASDEVVEEGEEDGKEGWDFDSTLRGSTATAQDTPPPATPPTPQPTPRRRRAPPEMLAPMRGPLERVFDAGTLTSYEARSRAHYSPSTQDSGSDLPLRRLVEAGGGRLGDGGGDETLKPPPPPPPDDGKRRRRTQEWTFASSLPAPIDGDANRRTQDWTFASASSSSSAAFDPHSNDDDEDADAAVGSGGGGARYTNTPPPPSTRQQSDIHRLSTAESLIDLDMSLSPRMPPPRMARPHHQQQPPPQSRASMAESLIDLDMGLLPSPLASPEHEPEPEPEPEPPTAAAAVPRSITLPQAQQSSQAMSVSVNVSPRPQPHPHPRPLPAPPSVEALSGSAGVDV
ncbi:hypothetical protein V494_01300, partial [Pseudogymnoascus sp. VKM F-4513 (FW-928)]